MAYEFAPTQTDSLAAVSPMDASAVGLPPQIAPSPYSDDKAILELFERLKKECMEQRWVFEREWLRDLYYVSGRQWIMYHPTRREWLDKRLAKWIPRPVTNKMAEVVQAIRTVFGAIELDVKARPLGNDPQAVAAAEIADQMAPLIFEENRMEQVMREADFWFITTGNACLQTSWDTDTRENKSFIQHEQCVTCGGVYPPQQIQQTGNLCPQCGQQQFVPAVGPDGKEIGEWIAFGKGKTTALSPFEYLIPPNVVRWDELPYIIRLRWRDKHWVDANLPEMSSKIQWEKSSGDRSLQLFKSLAMMNDSGVGTQFGHWGSFSSGTTEGITEYELWLKPTPTYPKGLVARIMGDRGPVVVRKEDEGIPGPFPFTDVEGKPLFPFMHAQYEQVGGRLYGRSALSPVIQKQDILNQIDSYCLLCLHRTANPVWVLPDGAGIEHFTGEPGLIMKWNPLAAGGTAKPERIEGANIPSFVPMLREQTLKDIEELTGTYDVIKGQKPTGVEAFSALQLLVERSQSRFTSAMKARGDMLKDTFSIQLELERKFGPEQRVWSVISPNRGYTFRHFENAQLQGQVSIVIEDGSNVPKTYLGRRAAIEQAMQMGIINPQDPEQRGALLALFGLSDMVPTLNIHVQTALQIQDQFEQWLETGGVDQMGQPTYPPLQFKLWYDPMIHYGEHVKWLNSDKMKELLAQNPQAEMIITQYIQQLQFLMAPPVQVDAEGNPIQGQQTSGGGAGTAMANSNQNSGATSSMPSGNAQYGPNVGPA